MHRLLRIKSPDQLAEHPRPGFPGWYDSSAIFRHQPQEHWVAVAPDHSISAECSLWWEDTPRLPDQKPGLIGHYAATDAGAAGQLLRHACSRLADRRCTLAIGPMDGSTWRRYRLLTERGTEPTFFLEPDNPDDWPDHFTHAGFHVLAGYYSAINTDLTRADPRLDRVRDRLDHLGIRLRPLAPDRFLQELEAIFTVARVSFRGNFLYTRIRQDAFIQEYQAIRPLIRSELILIAEREGEPIGFVFTLPNLRHGERGPSTDTAILKTVATLPDRQYAGLGSLLVAETQSRARDLGYHRVIHALMHQGNHSINVSSRYATPFRRYSLFANQLSS
ncbi:MAG TPA: GNAT family N-acetyltransferase [Methylomirabilota bacterium]|nr:GNAT family N-acetyltransferase [Methylomirabilota bacterium]